MEKKMENKNLEVFSNAPVPQAVLKNVLPDIVFRESKV